MGPDVSDWLATDSGIQSQFATGVAKCNAPGRVSRREGGGPLGGSRAAPCLSASEPEHQPYGSFNVSHLGERDLTHPFDEPFHRYPLELEGIRG